MSQEFYAKCRSSQELIYAQIPWASAGAERSRQGNVPRAANGSYPNLHSREDESPTELTVEEELLAALLVANEALLEALRLYDDLERVAIERETEELSRRDVRMDRGRLQYQDNEYGRQIEVPQAHVGDTSSRTPSPSPTDSPAVSFQQPAYIPSITHPLPRIPFSGHTSNTSSTHLSGYAAQNAALLPPPPAPHGPRSPAANHISSRTPSPDRFNLPPAHHSRTDSSASSRDYHAMRNGLSGLQIGQSLPQKDDDEDEVSTPIKPSAKALGKRKVVDVEESDRKSSLFVHWLYSNSEPQVHLTRMTCSMKIAMNLTQRKVAWILTRTMSLGAFGIILLTTYMMRLPSVLSNDLGEVESAL